MNSDVSSLSPLAKKIVKIISAKPTAENDYQIINKNQFDGETIDNFFLAIKELKESGLVSFFKEYEYVPYSNFGDMTTKQYGKMDILLKMTPEIVAN